MFLSCVSDLRVFMGDQRLSSVSQRGCVQCDIFQRWFSSSAACLKQEIQLRGIFYKESKICSSITGNYRFVLGFQSDLNHGIRESLLFNCNVSCNVLI